jgi:Cu/Ag efflux protein CusF
MRLFGVLLTMFAAATTAANGEASKSMPVPPSPVSPKSSTTARGEVTNIDKQLGTISIRHNALRTLQLSAATTVFAVKEKGILDLVKPGDIVEFKVEHATGLIRTMRVESSKKKGGT